VKSIGEFAKDLGLSVKAVRLYQDKGLLRPAFVDPWTGYRYFDERSVEQARQVCQLRDLEFSLAEIREILSHPKDDASLLVSLERQRSAVERRLQRYDQILRSLDERIQTSREALMSAEPFPIDHDAPSRVERWLARVARLVAGASSDANSVTVASAWGVSGGSSLAVVLGRRTGFDVWDGELLDAIVGDDSLRRSVLGALDDTQRKGNEERLRAVLDPGALAEGGDRVRRLSVALALSTFGRCILAEVGGSCLLPSDRTLHVRLVPTMSLAIPHHAKRNGLGDEAAEEDLQQRGRAIAAYGRDTFGRDLADPAGYDLVLNSSTLDLFGAVDLCVQAFESKLGPEPGWWCA